MNDEVVLYKLTNTGLRKIFGELVMYGNGKALFVSNDRNTKLMVATVSGIVYKKALWLYVENDLLAQTLFDEDLLYQIRKYEDMIAKIDHKRRLILKEVRV